MFLFLISINGFIVLASLHIKNQNESHDMMSPVFIALEC